MKAWNEWAEGNYVEPDALSGHAYLDAIKSVIYPSSTPIETQLATRSMA